MGSIARLEVRLAEGATPVWVGSGALQPALEELAPRLGGRRIFAVTTPPVRALHGEALRALEEIAGEFRVIEVADGERAKSVEGVAALWRRLLEAGGKRDSLVVAFGGGSVGDVAGFAAATFLRGIDFVQLPTTLLAQVDAAIGGKTAINLPEAKNCVGAFHHPLATIADTRFLATLAPRQIRCGLFEVLKTGVMLDGTLFSSLESGVEELIDGNPEALAPVVEATAAAKIGVVEQDPEEGNLRRLLNFGHTLGHALESVVADRWGSGALEHGEAVGYGMLFATSLAETLGFDPTEGARIRNLVRRTGLPGLPEGLPRNAVFERVARDKKARESGIAWVLPRAIGAGYIAEDVPGEKLSEALESFFADV